MTASGNKKSPLRVPIRIVLLGPPGAGKGTQAKLLAEKFSLAHISTGEILRAEISSGSELGKYAQTLMDKGNLVPDETVLQIIRKRVIAPDCVNGFILDGFPRTVPQAEALDKILHEDKTPLTAVIDIKVSDQILLDRIKKRAAGGSGRADDDLAVATNRLKVYWERTAPVTAYYKAENRVTDVNGVGSIEEVATRISSVAAA
jgi:adenylate kinase